MKNDLWLRSYYRLFGADGALREVLEDGASVLDVGTSDGSGSAILSRLSAFGVDIHRPSIVESRRRGLRSRCVQADILSLPYRNASFDAVTCLHVIEHLDKDAGWALLDELERVSRGVVVVQTPHGFLPQAARPEQPWFEHRSGWWPADFRSRGYEVRGAGGVRFARHRIPRTNFRWGPIGRAVAVASVPAVRRLPESGFDVLAIRRR